MSKETSRRNYLGLRVSEGKSMTIVAGIMVAGGQAVVQSSFFDTQSAGREGGLGMANKAHLLILSK